MSTQTLLPNGTRSGAGDFTVTGVSLIHTALNDSSDSTYVQRTSTTVTKSFVVNLGTYTLAADEAIQSVRIGVRMVRGGAQSKLYVRQGYVTDAAAGTIRYAAADQYVGSLSGPTTVYGAERTVAPDGQPWDQTRLNDLVVKVTDYSPTSGGRSTIYEVFAEVVVNDQPTVTVTSPTGTVTDTSRPAVEWTYADTDGDPQSVYQVRVFTAAEYGVAGFDPETSSASWDTGLVFASDPGVTPTVDLENDTTHRAYVRVGHALGTSVYLSAWAYSQFTLDYDSPPAPEIVASFSAINNAVFVTATGRTNYLSADDASAESTAGTWANVTNAAVVRSTAAALTGSASIRLTASANGTMQAATDPYPIATDGQTISARASFRADANGRNCRVILRWFDDAAFLSATNGSTVLDSISGWVDATVSGVPPAGATRAAVAVEVASAAGAEVHYVDKISMNPGPTALWSPGGLYDSQVIVLERSIDDGDTWAEISEIDASVPSQQVQGDDFAAPRGQSVVYRARVIGFSGQDAVASGYSVNAAAFVANDEKWWIKAPGRGDLTVGGARVLGGSAIQQTREAAQGVFRPLGRDRAVVVTGDVYGYDGSYDVLAVGDEEWAALEALLLDYTGDLVVQSPFGETRTVRVVSRSVSIEGTPTLPRRIVSVSYVEV